MSNLKKFEDFMKESTDNKGKGVDGDTDLFPKPPVKQTINKGSLNPIDNLGIMGHQITTEKIDGIVKSVKDGIVYVEERLTKEVKEYSISEFLKEFNKFYKKQKKSESEVKIEESKFQLSDLMNDYKGEIEWNEEDKEILNRIIYGDNPSINESKKDKDIWQEKWEDFAKNYMKSTKNEDLFEDLVLEDEVKEIDLQEKKQYIVVDDDFNRAHYVDLIGKKFDNPPSYAHIKVLEETEDVISENVDVDDVKFDEIKVDNFSDFTKRLRLKPDVIDEDIENLDENAVPEQLPQIECADCGVFVDDEEKDKVRHLYSKHNFKPTTDDMEVWLLEYFPPKSEKK